jgi:hypothetical protein
MVKKVRKNSRSRTFELVLGKIVELKHWSAYGKSPYLQTRRWRNLTQANVKPSPWRRRFAPTH